MGAFSGAMFIRQCLFHVTSYELRVTSYKLQVASYELQVTSYTPISGA